ncbi:MAG: DUF1080 domain-containing protein [Phycisphaeraceae bacterium]|nr:DUF1080 domain-containing protein [Phycisphaeraceae bacterium]
MKESHKLSFLLVAVLLISGLGGSLSLALEEGDPPSEKDDGWEILFDGTSTDAFRGWKTDMLPRGWVIEEDGSLHAKDRSRDIITRNQYSDFDLRLEWKLSKGANSGLMYRVAEKGHHPHDTGPEYQIIDDDRVHKSSTASLYGLVTPNDKAKINPTGEWNSSRIVVEDNNVQHYLNGKLVVEYVWDSDEIKRRLEKSKFKNWPGYMQQDTGHIGFQSHGKDLWFRNIKIKEVPDPEPVASTEGGNWRVLFDGSSAEHFRSFKSEQLPKNWSVEDGLLHYAGGRLNGDIVTKQAFGDFDLRWEWKISQGGNSGVKYRVDLNKPNNGIYAWGLEYQILDDGKHRNGKNPKTTAGALYSLIPPNDNKQLKPVGEWNASRIVLKDNVAKHYLNGELVVEYTIGSELFEKLIAKSKYKNNKTFGKTDPGHIVFQEHQDKVWYRNIRIKELD